MHLRCWIYFVDFEIFWKNSCENFRIYITSTYNIHFIILIISLIRCHKQAWLHFQDQFVSHAFYDAIVVIPVRNQIVSIYVNSSSLTVYVWQFMYIGKNSYEEWIWMVKTQLQMVFPNLSTKHQYIYMQSTICINNIIIKYMYCKMHTHLHRCNTILL